MNLCRAITAPDVAMSHEAEKRVCPPPLRVMFQTGSGEDRKSINDSTQTLAQNQALKICHDSLPFIIIGIGQSLKRKLSWKESIFW